MAEAAYRLNDSAKNQGSSWHTTDEGLPYMTGTGTVTYRLSSPAVRVVLGSVCVLIVIAVLAGAASIPYLYDSPSIRYKLGLDKTFLRAGKVMGMCAAVLLLFQLLLTSRFKILDRIFALNQLYIFHRVNAVIIALIALIHPLFVFAPEDISNIPVELKYWPEMVGALLMLLIWLMMATGIWRLFLDFSFHRWWSFHRAAAFTAAAALVVHVLYVSESFESGLPRNLVIGAAVIYILLLARVKIVPLLLKRTPYRVKGITKVGKDDYAIEVIPLKGNVIQYIPGQFAFISFKSRHISSEEHPFTISSSPSRPGSLMFTIRCSGDWTGHIGKIKSGDTLYVDGPYGRFSHFTVEEKRDLVFIAGGIGITPFLSMLRYMADTGDSRGITLIWSNRTGRDIVYENEFRNLEKRLPGLSVSHIFTRNAGHGEHQGRRLDRSTLEGLLSGTDRASAVFICGPPTMMRDVQRHLIDIGFRSGSVHMEKFSL